VGKTNVPAQEIHTSLLSVRTRDKVMAKADSIRGTRSTVLMIDDDPSLLRSLARLVRVSGYEVRTFSRPSALP
jgi:hypothetical protein